MATKRLQPRTMCANCGKRRLAETVVQKKTGIQYEGKVHEVYVPDLVVLKCASCNTVYLDNRADKQYRRALRNLLGLLQPEEIKSNRKGLELLQEQLADDIHITAESLSRWENGHVIQSRSHDLLLRTYFTMPEFRERVAKARLSARFVTTWSGVKREPKIILLQSNNIQMTDSSAADTQLALAA